MKILVADTLTLTKDDKIYGHYHKTSKQFYDILSKENDVMIAGGKTYHNYFEDSIIYDLPFYITKSEFDNNNLVAKIKRLVKAALNVLIVLKSDVDIIIFQDCIQTLLYRILKFVRCKKKIVLIKYAVDERERTNNALFSISDKIDGMITSLDDVKKFYNFNTLIIPDYFPEQSLKPLKNGYEQDFLLIGTVMPEKDYEMVVEIVAKTKYTLLIAGYFPDKNYKRKLESYKSDNIRIVDRYLTDAEYSDAIEKSKFVILPYKKGYSLKSSGVVLDALYRGVPVIVPRLKSFSFVEDYNLGLVYSDSLEEVFDDLDNFLQISESLYCFINEKNEDKEKLSQFIRGIFDGNFK